MMRLSGSTASLSYGESVLKANIGTLNKARQSLHLRTSEVWPITNFKIYLENIKWDIDALSEVRIEG